MLNKSVPSSPAPPLGYRYRIASFNRALKDNGAAVGTFIGLFAVWEIACDVGNVPQWLLPAPSRILQELWLARAILPGHILATAFEVIAGFGLSVLIGIPLSILIVLSPLARKVVYPILIVLQSVPKVALAPILMIWIGYGSGSKILIAAVTAFFPIIINTSAGMEAVPRELLELTRSLNSPSLKVFWKVRLPFATPYLFSGMKVAMALALIGAVVGEFVGADRGLGYLILTFSSTMNTALVFGAMTLLALLGIFLFYVVSWAEKLICPWHESTDRERYL